MFPQTQTWTFDCPKRESTKQAAVAAAAQPQDLPNINKIARMLTAVVPHIPSPRNWRGQLKEGINTVSVKPYNLP